MISGNFRISRAFKQLFSIHLPKVAQSRIKFHVAMYSLGSSVNFANSARKVKSIHTGLLISFIVE